MKALLNHKARLLFKSTFGISEIQKFENNFLNTTNVAYIQSLYEKWQADKNSVSKSFQAYFELLESGEDPQDAYSKPPKEGEKLQISMTTSPLAKQMKFRMLIDRIRSLGHQFAKLDPLDHDHQGIIGKIDRSVIDYKSFDLTEAETKDLIYRKSLRADQVGPPQPYTIEQVKDYLEEVYCGPIGYQFMHLLERQERVFLRSAIQKNIETLQAHEPTKEQRLATFERLCKDQCFVDFLGTKFSNTKRYGIEGLNSAISAMGKLFESAAEKGAEYIVLGMAHRGRFNTLHCVFDTPAQTIIKQFLQKKDLDDSSLAGGDVKYHLSYTTKKKYGDKQVTLSLLPNPSHLEAVDPLIYGQTRSIQESIGDKERQKALGVLVHGDAAISGQGIVYQSLQMNQLKDYTVGGIIHVVFNNQLGFTTNPSQGRSSYYCTEIAKAVGAPVFHVNGDQPDTLDLCMKIALDYRYKFKKDIFIDIVGYRKYGHNEQDQPFFTQPKMYEKIQNKDSMFTLYSKKLIEKGILTQEEVENTRKKHMKNLQQDYQKVLNDKGDVFPNQVSLGTIRKPTLWGNKTGVPKNVLSEVFKKISVWPQDFNIHPTIKKIYEERIKNMTNNQPLDWATMESLAFSSLLYEGYQVRLSGQDVERGTFSHRHAYISDQKRDVPKYLFLKNVSPKVTVTNSHLSQFGVTGFQYGYSITNPNALVIWQAQFGDFANGAQIMIDNFIVSAQVKWNQQSGLVLNLPHGMDGQGPQHSSARMERFLQLSNDNCDVVQKLSHQQALATGNIQVVCCSTTSNYFHVLRRQLRRDYRKPLILFNSKKLLKFKPANSYISEIQQNTQFVSVYSDQLKISKNQIKKVLLCNGQFYYELKTQRDELKRNDIAIIRIQELAPFPHEKIKKVLEGYNPNAQYIWVQEEHENYGAWNYIRPRLNILLGKKVSYIGRRGSASTAVGTQKLHKKQERQIINKIFHV